MPKFQVVKENLKGRYFIMEKYELLNENPRILYVEKDYEGIHVYQEETSTEIKLIFNKNASDKLKEIFKKSCVNNILNPKQYETIKVGAN